MSKRPAIFLDRDGTIIRQVENLRDVRELFLLPGAARAIRSFNRLGYFVVVITNQPIIARGWLTEKQVESIHGILIERLARLGAKIDAIFYCPHHPNANVKKYRKACRCRKPKPGMILDAIRKFGIGRKRSFMVGDHAWDILAGKAAKLRTILVHTNSRSRDPAYAHVKPDFTVRNLPAAVRIIKRHAN